MDGWIKLHRKTLENPVVCKDSDYIAVWMYLLLNATHKEYPAMFAGEKILLQPGQLITGRKSISERFNISESKVQRILKSFEIEHQIEQQNSNKNRLISILSWSDYQEDEQQNEQQVNNKRTTTEQQVNTNKNVKNVKNKRTKEIKDIIPKILFAEFVSMTQEEYDKLISTHGESRTIRMIEILNNYKGSSGKKYKSDYLAILNWVVKRVEEEETKNGYRQPDPFGRRQTTSNQHHANHPQATGDAIQQQSHAGSISEAGRSIQANGAPQTTSKYDQFVRR